MTQNNHKQETTMKIKLSILTALLCTITLGNSHGMETGNTANPTQLFNESSVRADWNFTEFNDKSLGVFKADGKRETVATLQIKNETLKFGEENGILYVAIPCTENRTLIIRQGKDITPPTEGDIKKVMNCEERRVQIFSAPIVTIESEAFKFFMNHKGVDEGIDALVMKPLYQVTKGVTLSYEEKKSELIATKKPPTIKITDPFTFVYLNSANKILVQGQVINTNGMMDALRKPMKVIVNGATNVTNTWLTNDTMTTEDCQCVMF